LYRNGTVKIKANNQLKVYASPDTSDAEFQKMCAAASVTKTTSSSTSGSKLVTLQNKIEQQELDVKAAENAVTQRNLEAMTTGGGVVLGMLGVGRKKSLSSGVSKLRMVQAAKDKLAKEKQDLENLKEQLAALQASQNGAVPAGSGTTTSFTATELPLSPTKSDIFSDVFGVAWMPYYIVKVGGQTQEIPAYKM
jgi:hypothetical protein